MLNIHQLSFWEKKTFFDQIDFLIIGAGIVGYNTALFLKKKNPDAKILIIEKGYLPSGASTKNAGFACFGSPSEIYDDLKKIKEKEVWETVAKRWEGLIRLKEIVSENNMDYQRNGSWEVLSFKQTELKKELDCFLPELNKKIKEITGVDNVYSIDDKISDKFGFKNIYSSYYNLLEAQIDTGKLMQYLHKVSIENNILILFGINVLDIEINDGIVKTNIGDIVSEKVIICTNGFASKLLPDEDVSPARAQVLITKPIPNLKIKGTFHYEHGFYYFRNIYNRILLGGGRNLDIEGETTFEFKNTVRITEELKDLLANIILPDTSYEIDYFWSGIMGTGKSKSPIIKQIGTKTYCGVRLGGMGVAIGALVGQELAELSM